MTPDNDNKEDNSQLRVIASAIVLAIIVIGAIWFTFFRAPSSIPKAIPKASPKPITQTSPLPVYVQESPSPEASLVVEGAAIQTPQSVEPTSETGPADWIIPAAIAAIMAGAYPLLRLKK